MQVTTPGFETVYRREFPFVWAAARRLGVHPAVLDDVVQDVFLTAYRRWDDLDYEVSPRAWLYGVTRRVAFRYRRTEARTRRRKAVVAQARAGMAHDPQADRDDARDIEVVLARLEPGRREVFVMSDLLGMSGPEVAAELAIPLNTVYSRLRLARRQLERRAQTRVIEEWARGARRATQPPPGQARRSWALLLPSLGPVPGAVTGAWISSKATGWVTAAAVVGALVTVGWQTTARAPSTTASRSTTAVVAPVEARHHSVPARDSAAAPPAVERTRVATAPAVERESVHHRSAGSAPSSTRRGVDRAAQPPNERASRGAVGSGAVDSSALGVGAPGASAVEPGAVDSSGLASQVAPEPSALEAEVAVLDRAASALRQDDVPRSLEWLSEHARRFPRGHLADVRRATRIRALCRLGRDAQAHAEARRLRHEFPNSAVAQRVPDSCDEA